HSRLLLVRTASMIPGLSDVAAANIVHRRPNDEAIAFPDRHATAKLKVKGQSLHFAVTHMLGEPRIGLKPLAALCRRLSLSMGAGVDVRTVWTREAQNAQGFGRRRFEAVSEGVAEGRTVSDALEDTGEYFPKFFRELIKVGEQTGHLPEVCRQLAEHYEHQLRMRRTLLASITWPAIELTLALGVIGLVIWVMGAIPALAKSKTDMLGFG